MAAQDHSIGDLVKSAIGDAQELVRSEIALAKAEIRADVRRMGAGVAMLAAAAVAGMIGLVFLLTAVAWGLSAAFGWAVWIGFASVAGVVLLVAAGLALAGRGRLAAGEHLPLTRQTLKENLQWMRARTS